MIEYKKYLEVALEAAKTGGEILENGYGSLFEVKTKEGRNNLVTEFDFKSEKAIKKCIHNYFPEHEILGEEFGLDEAQSDYRWIIDPLDGTVNFVHSIPIFSVSIALEYKKEIIVGVIYHPILKETFTAIKGQGAFLNGKAIHVSDNAELNNAILVTGFPYNINENPLNAIETFVSMVKLGLPVRRLGSAALDLAYVAAGRFDAFWEGQLKPWDVAAGYLIVEEAGGKVTDYRNNKYSVYGDTILASNNAIHESMSIEIQDIAYSD